MKNTLRACMLLLMLLPGFAAKAQTAKEKAEAKGREAVKLMDAGKYGESLALLKEACELDPDRFDLQYELALVNYLKADYRECIRILEYNDKHKDVTDLLFQLLGNSYDVSGNSEKAIEAYDAGLKKFPKSGKLYLEKGNVFWGKKEYDKALTFYEEGIKADPAYPSNYYRATRIYLSSSQKVWGLIYGEIFMNLERNSARTAEISEMLYKTYEENISFKGKNKVTTSFCQTMFINAESLKDSSKFKLPYCMIYEPTLLIAIADEKSFSQATMVKSRSSFTGLYFQLKHNENYPNVLFDYQQRLEKEGHLEAYNYWILMKGDEKSFTKWQAKNEDKWGAFVRWFTDNPLRLDDTHFFHSSQY